MEINKLVEEIGKLTMQEAADMGRLMEDKWGIQASNLQAAPAQQEVVSESSTATVILKSFADGQKIPMIKVVRPILDLGLLEAKNFIEDLPKAIKEDIDKEDAEKLKKLLEEAGGTVELKWWVKSETTQK